jgi:hypothetical protein
MIRRARVMYRESLLEDGELDAIQANFLATTQSRMDVAHGDIVIGRCCMLPFYNEVERDIRKAGGTTINTYAEHRYIADIGEYIADIGELTPKTWRDLADVPKDGGPFVLKGETNSAKRAWSTMMFAKDWYAAGEVYSRLSQDGLIGEQRIYIRQYIPLMNLGESIGGCPLTKEFRFFVYHGQVLSGGFYWHAFAEDILEQGGKVPTVAEVPEEFLREAISRVASKAPFVVIDVAQGADGRWWVIELNDGQQSGLSANKPEVLFSALRQKLESEGILCR